MADNADDEPQLATERAANKRTGPRVSTTIVQHTPAPDMT
jgi:hypothetical protein